MSFQKQHILDAIVAVGTRNKAEVASHLIKVHSIDTSFAPPFVRMMTTGIKEHVRQVLKTMSLADLEYIESFSPTMVEISAQELYVSPVYIKNEHDLDESQNWYVRSIGEYRHAMELIVARPDLADEVVIDNAARILDDQRSHDRFVASIKAYRGDKGQS